MLLMVQVTLVLRTSPTCFIRYRVTHVFDVFAVNGVTITNGLGYDWKTSDYTDGADNLPTQTANKQKM
jgi:hypothetical protein